MAECSQKFQDMLDELIEDAICDHVVEGGHSTQTLRLEYAILQYVAELEEYKRTFMVRGYGDRPQDMTGGMP